MTLKVGLLVGREWSWPPAFIEEVAPPAEQLHEIMRGERGERPRRRPDEAVLEPAVGDQQHHERHDQHRAEDDVDALVLRRQPLGRGDDVLGRRQR